ncbi:competence type IV pilus minor pilin ComGF [Solibacillus sp. FSL H8-0538]|uniref:competence type IV pilus minor pilin ComGF n=1 Tax=Solibacillus sp. FSL H8-0538 TaxID=2921400 RepID=UPI0030F5DE1B
MRIPKRRSYLGDAGYTFIEAVFQLIVFMLFAQIVILIIMWFTQFQTIDKMKDQINWELFVFDVNQYLLHSKEFELLSRGAGIKVNAHMFGEQKIYIIEKSEKHIRKASTLGGNEIMLGFVDSATFSVNGNELLLQVTMKNGVKRERIFIVPTTSK